MKTLPEYLKSKESHYWQPEDSVLVLRHVEQVEAVYRQLLSGKAEPRKEAGLKLAAEVLNA